MKISDQYMKVGRKINRSRKSIYHILQRNTEERDTCLCGAIIFDTNGWNIILDDDDDERRVSLNCEKAYKSVVRAKRWKQ